MMDELLNVEEAAKILGLSKNYMYLLRSRGKGPRSFKHGKELRYRREDIDTYLKFQENATAKGGQVDSAALASLDDLPDIGGRM